MNDYQINVLRLSGQGFCCTQIPVMLILEAHGVTNNALLRTIFPLCHGFPDTRGPCGALVGGVCLLGYFAGKGTANRENDERLTLMQSELTQWFEEICSGRFASINCSDITDDGQPNPSVCGDLIARTYAKTLEILVENGFDPQEEPEGD